MTPMSALGELAGFASSLRVRDLPPEIVAKAKTCLIDALFGNFLVSVDPRARAALRAVAADGAEPGATIVGTPHRAHPGDAAFVNAASTAATDRSDTHPATATHPGIMTVPPALALAEQRGRDGASLIVALVAGYETMCRLARAVIRPEIAAIFRPTALVGPTAAAVAAARVLDLPADRIVVAASLATQTASGFNEWAHAGTSEHPFHAAFAVRNAVTATLLAEHGVDSAPTVLDGASGLLAGFGSRANAAVLTRGLGRDWEMASIVHKPAPACFFVQAPCQLAQEIARRPGFDPRDIDRIEIRVTDTAARYPGCDNPGPITAHQGAIMSLQFSVASVLTAGRVVAESWRNYTDPAVNDLAGRSSVVVDGLLTAAYPARQGVRLRLSMRRGAAVEVAQEDFRSMSRDEVVARFLESATPNLGAPRAAATIACIDRLEHLADIRELTSLIRTS
ncbi:MAG: MmgE/PrpD family protein [Alphaproteobacteria bacterium]|nr:MmgE/PrpD family protein [Alphaproteobacteria bacterium]